MLGEDGMQAYQASVTVGRGWHAGLPGLGECWGRMACRPTRPRLVLGDDGMQAYQASVSVGGGWHASQPGLD